MAKSERYLSLVPRQTHYHVFARESQEGSGDSMTQIHRHTNGFGKVSSTGAASSDSFIDRTSELRGLTFLSFMSQVRENSVLDGQGGVTNVSASVIERSIILNSQISYAKVSDSVLNNVVVRGAYDPALLESVILSGGVTVEACRLRNFELSGPFLVHADWDRQPRHFTLERFGIQLGVIECWHDGVLHGICGCKCRPLHEWIEKKELLRRFFGKRDNWDHGVVDYIHDQFNEWLSQPLV